MNREDVGLGAGNFCIFVALHWEDVGLEACKKNSHSAGWDKAFRMEGCQVSKSYFENVNMAFDVWKCEYPFFEHEKMEFENTNMAFENVNVNVLFWKCEYDAMKAINCKKNTNSTELGKLCWMARCQTRIEHSWFPRMKSLNLKFVQFYIMGAFCIMVMSSSGLDFAFNFNL